MVAASGPDTSTYGYITNFSSDGIQWQPLQKRSSFASQVTILVWNEVAPGRLGGHSGYKVKSTDFISGVLMEIDS